MGKLENILILRLRSALAQDERKWDKLEVFIKHIFLYILITVLCTPVHAMQVQAVSTEYAKVPLVLAVIDDGAKLHDVATIIEHDLSFSGQFSVTIKQVSHNPTKRDIKQLFSDGFLLAVFISKGNKKTIEWRVYDTLQGKMVQGKGYIKRGTISEGWAHNIADAVWSMLTGQDGFFSTKIAYCKDVRLPNRKTAKQVCVADYDGNNEQILVNLPTINVAPRWNKDLNNPLLFYSEFTNKNVRLVAVTMDKKRRITSNFDGINMLPAFSHDGTKVVYCASKGKGHCQLYYGDKVGFRKLTDNDGNNISPSLSDDGQSIFFCSDYQTGSPQVYVYYLATGKIERITKGGYCASPSYCAKRKQLAYAKMVDGIMQLFVYDELKKTHTQLTTSPGNKEECSWSPCGNYLIYSDEQNGSSRIAMLHLLTRQQRYLTSAKERCSYPDWSPVYAQFPAVHV